MIIDSRDKKHGRTVVKLSPATKVVKATAVKATKKDIPVVPAHSLTVATGKVDKPTVRQKSQNPNANPLNWKLKDIPDISVAGLGCTRRFKKHPSKVFTLDVMRWNDPVGASDAAIKKATGSNPKEPVTEL